MVEKFRLFGVLRILADALRTKNEPGSGLPG
jgi:hypothetical protein